MCFFKWQYMSFNIKKTYIHISYFITCRIIFNTHVHVMYYKQPCRLQSATSYHTVLGFPILARVPAQNFSSFEFIHATLCVCSFWMDLLVQNDHLHDPLKDWNSQGYRFTMSLYFISGWRWAFVRHMIRVKRVIFDNLVHFNFIIIMYKFFFLPLSSVMVSYRGSPG